MNQQEFAGLTEAVKARLYRTAYLYLGNEDDALEAVDEAVYQALRGLKQLRQPDFFETWITRILINACHNELRRRKRFHPGGDDALPDTAGPDAYGCTQAETAAALRIPQGTAATRQKRALALLKLELGEEEQV